MISRHQIEYIRSLAHKKDREKAGCFVAEGEKLVADLLKTDLSPLEIYYTGEGIPAFGPLTEAGNAIRLSDKEMGRISAFKNPSSVLALFSIPEAGSVGEDSFRGLNIVLDGIQDPGNLGTIVRMADWFGISNIFCSHECADLYNPKCVQSTMGALARVRVHYLDLNVLLKEAARFHVPVFGTYMEGENLFAIELPVQALVVMGNEGKGISRELIPLLTKKISIPAYPAGSRQLESLNVAVSASIVCAEFRRRMT